MVYIFDTSSLRVLQNYFPDSFPTFWQYWAQEVAQGNIISVREVKRELDLLAVSEHLINWSNSNRDVFFPPTDGESDFVGQIFSVPHFRQLISAQNQLKGMPVADPFVIASASIRGGCVVTEETERPNASRIPNVCRHFGIPCINLQQFIANHGWRF